MQHRRKEPWVCTQCGERFATRKLMYDHKHKKHPFPKTWNKGLTKETDPRVAKGVETLKQRISEGLVKNHWEGKHLPDEIRKKISASMKKAHTEGRAHNIGESRWNNEPSWPEKWFMQVIENEFTDKNYVREKPFHRFSLDFAWEHKKKCIEIDGQQHELLPGYKERDLRKDKALADEGWQVLRLPWSDVFNEPKKYIQMARQFIDE
jgi:very-short-patch-repair endonuclease